MNNKKLLREWLKHWKDWPNREKR